MDTAPGGRRAAWKAGECAMRPGLLSPLIKLVIFIVVTVLATAFLAISIANYSGGGTPFKARFRDVTSLNAGDEVRIAGVRVGKVVGVRVVDRNMAEVAFELSDRNWLPANTAAAIRYRNLVGQRYLALSQETAAGDEAGRKLGRGSTLRRTHEAVNLTTLFDGFRPLFQTLQPADVNKLSLEIIKVFQGEGGTITELLGHTAELTGKIADKDAVIGAVIKNLTTLLSTVNQREDQFNQLIINAERFVSGLAAERATVGAAVQSLGDLATATGDLLVPVRPSLQGSIAGLSQVSAELDRRRADVNLLLKNLPLKLERLGRVGSYGSWFQFYLCGIDIVAGPGTAEAPNLHLPVGMPTINQPIYTNAAPRCNGQAPR